MEFYDWLLTQGKSPKTAKNYSSPMSGKLSKHAALIKTIGFNREELLSDKRFENYCSKYDETGELYALNKRGKDMYRRAMVMYSEYAIDTQLSNQNINTIFYNKVIKAKKDSQEDRIRRLGKAHKMPTKIMSSIEVYDRNPDVVAEVLLRAKGICEHCKQIAPFTRKLDNTPYLEVHHKQPLSKGGEDTIENAEALCPNCHREKHYGI